MARKTTTGDQGRKQATRDKSRALKAQQLALFPHGGARRGAGRKRKAPRPRVSHRARPELSRHHPVSITVRVREGLPTLRRAGTFEILEQHFRAGSDRFGFRLVHFSVQSNHIHLIVEAEHEQSLSKGMQGLLVRLARGMNKAWQRKGSVFDDRYFARALTTPKEVRNALVYVLANAKKHGSSNAALDPYASCPWFDGWKNAPGWLAQRATGRDPPVVPARTWLLRTGWRRGALIRIEEAPARVTARAREHVSTRLRGYAGT